MARHENGYQALTHELEQERVVSLRRRTEKLEATLQRLASLTPESPEYRAVHRDAQRQLWYLLVQRESMGLRQHDALYDVLHIPPSVNPQWFPEEESGPD